MILQHIQWTPLLPVTNHIQKKFVQTSSTGTGAIVGRQITTVCNNSSHSSLGNEDLSNVLTEPLQLGHTIKGPPILWSPDECGRHHPPLKLSGRNFLVYLEEHVTTRQNFSFTKAGLCWKEPGIPKISAFTTTKGVLVCQVILLSLYVKWFCCSYTSSDFIGFWVNSLVVVNRD
jgi:hypothetical protein